jgi:hypothetical protein
MKFKYTCKEAVDVMVAGQDRRLALSERLLLRLHLLVCKACPRFRGQLALLSQAMAHWREHPDER